MKRYWLFIYPCHYPSGGMHDYEKSFDTKEEAVAEMEQIIDVYEDNAEIFDSHTFINYLYCKNKIHKFEYVGEKTYV